MNQQFFRQGLEATVAEPFPHRDWSSALNPDLYEELSASFPLDQFGDVLSSDNHVFRVDSRDLLANNATPSAWREVIDYLTSQRFWEDLVRVFGGDIRRRHPELERAVGRPLEQWKVCRRDEPDADVRLEALPVINTPVRTKPTYVRGPHIDKLDKLWTGLIYMRSQDDDTPGGELHLHRAKREVVFDARQIPASMTEVARTIPYEANRMVTFVNAPDAIHSVGARPPTPHIRRYINLVVELPGREVFQVQEMGLLQRARFRLSGGRKPVR